MKNILKYITLLAGIVSLSACTTSSVDETSGDQMGRLRLSLSIGNSRAEYNALDHSTMRVYKIEGGEEKLIRKYQPATDAPGDFYLVAGQYRIKVAAGDQSAATFTNKSYYGELDVNIIPKDVVIDEVVCKITNVGVQVVFDQTILDKMDLGFKTFVSASDNFSKAEAENNSVPTLSYTEDGTGYFLLPEGVSNLSWGFYGSSTQLGEVSKTGFIPNPEKGTLHTLKFKYSKTPDGYLGITVQVEENGEIHEDPFIFSPQPSIKGNGVDMNSVIGYNATPISFNVSSVQALGGIRIQAGEQNYTVMENGSVSPDAAANGISYTPQDENNGTLTLEDAFFAKFQGGIHDIVFTMTDVTDTEGTGTAHIAVTGLTDLSNYDLWLNTANFQVIMTDPSISNVKVRYRERLTGETEFGEWKTATAAVGENFTYTAQATDFAAGRDYEYQLLINDAEQGTVRSMSTDAGVQIPNGDFETWTYFNSTYYPCPEGEIGNSTGTGTAYMGFWGSGNPAAKSGGMIITSPTSDVRPGSKGTQAALLETKSFLGQIAAGNIFVGTFGGVHNIKYGDVYMGRPFTFNARPKAIKFWYKGTVGSNDKARLFICMGKWSSYHKVDTYDQSTFFNPSDESLPEGPIYGYGDWIQETTVNEWTEITLPITYRSDEMPNYLMITASSSYRGDYMEGSTDSKMYLDDIEFVY